MALCRAYLLLLLSSAVISTADLTRASEGQYLEPIVVPYEYTRARGAPGSGAIANGSVLQILASKLVEALDTIEFTRTFANMRNEQCVMDLVSILGELKTWMTAGTLPKNFILQMLDSWGKFIPSGILEGHLSDPGDFDECINAAGDLNSKQTKGTYTLAVATFFSLGPNDTDGMSGNSVSALSRLLEYMQTNDSYVEPIRPRFGLCFPNSCNQQDLGHFVNNLAQAIIGEDVKIELNPLAVKMEGGFMTADGVMIVILLGIAMIIGLASIMDIIIRSSGTKLQATYLVTTVRVFSIPENTSKLFNGPVKYSKLSCLHGIQVLSLAWVILGQSWYLLRYQFIWNEIELKESTASSWWMLILTNSTLAGDTFLLVSGTAVAYRIMQELDKRRFDLFHHYFMRYLRVTVPLCVVVGFTATLFGFTGKGPLWNYVDEESKKCSQHWWQTIWYVSTILDTEYTDMCHAHASWYLSNDMLYFILAPLFVYLLWRWSIIGLVLLSLWILQSTVQTGVIIAQNELAPTYLPLIREDLNLQFWTSVYKRPWTRSAPYALGIALGYIIHILKSKQDGKPVSRWVTAFGWTVHSVVAILTLFLPAKFFDPASLSDTLGSYEAIVYGSVHRFTWSVAVAWVIFACATGQSAWVNGFLSWRLFVPLGRLSFCAFLCSYYVQLVHYASNYHPVEYGSYLVITSFLFHLIASYAIGFLLCVTLESPLVQMERWIRGEEGSEEEQEEEKQLPTVFVSLKACPLCHTNNCSVVSCGLNRR